VTAQILDRGLTCFRIGDPAGAYPIFDATGSTIAPGRWNTIGSPMIYASEHYSTALLEKLVHGSGALPPNQHFITITIPRGMTYEQRSASVLARPGVSKRGASSWWCQASSRGLSTTC
jgi:RES domain-containing protein